MKKTVKIISIAVVLVMALALLASCGGGEGGASTSGETKTLNNITILVPDGFDIKEGLIPTSTPVIVYAKDQETKYVNINYCDSIEDAKTDTSFYVGDLETTDVKFDAAGITWEGVSYALGGWPMCDLYGTFGDQVVLCRASFFESDDATMRAIVDSIKFGE